MNLSNYFALWFVIVSCLNYTSSKYRIVGGRYWNIRSSPYLVSIHYRNRNRCVGTIVTNQKVVTAANCVADLENNLLIVAAGVTELNYIPRLAQVRYVEDVLYPNNYDRATKHMDIAVVKVCPLFDFRGIVQPKPISRCSFERLREIRVSGWGWTTVRNGRTSPTLQSTLLSSLPYTECENRYRSARKVFTESMICAAHPTSDTCNEDSGAPGIVDKDFCAVVSHNPDCMNPCYPVIFTNFDNQDVMDFLNSAIAAP